MAMTVDDQRYTSSRYGTPGLYSPKYPDEEPPPNYYMSSDDKAREAGMENPAYDEDKSMEVSDGKQHFGVDENEERGNWSGRLDFLLSCLGYAVGLGNVWRFPYLCYKSGGGAFFIPYVIMLVFVGIPIFFLELYLGQFTSQGCATCWGYAPLFTGLGWAMNVISGLVGIYYNMIIGWSLYYLFASFTYPLPWKDCTRLRDFYDVKPKDYCHDDYPNTNCTDAGLTRYAENGTCYNGTSLEGIFDEKTAKLADIVRKSASEIYFNRVAMGVEDDTSIDNVGGIVWYQALCLLLAWVIVFLCMIKGVKSSGKVVYFTALFPYAVLVILLVRGAMLEGHLDGIKFYLTPDWEKLKDSQVWKAATAQIFFSLSASWGGLITLASYNRFHNNLFRDALIVSVGNCLTSFFAGFVIFSYLGYMAKQLNVEVGDVAKGGVGLAFIVYPQAVTLMPVETLWAILFFFMLITLGLDSQFTLLETVCTSLTDVFPQFMRKRKTLVMLGISVVFYIIGLGMCTRGGSLVLTLIDSYAGGWNVMMLALFETISIGWIYGMKRLTNDVKIMIGFNPGMPWWGLNWMIISPALVLFVLIFSWMDYTPVSDGGKDFPVWANGIGWFFAVVSVGGVPAIALYMLIFKASGSFTERYRQMTTPSRTWGPMLPKHRRLVNYVQGFDIDPKNETPRQSVSAGDNNNAFENPNY